MQIHAHEDPQILHMVVEGLASLPLVWLFLLGMRVCMRPGRPESVERLGILCGFVPRGLGLFRFDLGELWCRALKDPCSPAFLRQRNLIQETLRLKKAS